MNFIDTAKKTASSAVKTFERYFFKEGYYIYIIVGVLTFFILAMMR